MQKDWTMILVFNGFILIFFIQNYGHLLRIENKMENYYKIITSKNTQGTGRKKQNEF